MGWLWPRLFLWERRTRGPFCVWELIAKSHLGCHSSPDRLPEECARERVRERVGGRGRGLRQGCHRKDIRVWLATGAHPDGQAHGPKTGTCFSSQMHPCPYSAWRPPLVISPLWVSFFCLPSFSVGCTLRPHVTVSPEAWSPAQAVGLLEQAARPALLGPPSLRHLCPGVLGVTGRSGPEAGTVKCQLGLRVVPLCPQVRWPGCRSSADTFLLGTAGMVSCVSLGGGLRVRSCRPPDILNVMA